MKRTIMAMLIALVVALGVLAIQTSVSPDAIRTDVERALSAWADRPVTVSGTAEVRLLPLPGVRWTDVAVTAPETGASLGHVDEITVALSPIDLVFGHATRGTVTLLRPELRIPPLDRPTMADLTRRLARIVPLHLVIHDGRLIPTDPSDAVEALEADLDWGAAGARLSGAAEFRWHGAAATLKLRGPQPGELVQGRATPITVAATGPGLDAAFDGTFALDASHRVDGTLSLSLADPAVFAHWIGRPREADLFGGALELQGDVHTTAATATLAISRATFGGAHAQGVLSFRWDTPDPLAGGTLAFDTIDLRDDHATFFGPGWAAVALDRDRWPLALDLRLSAGRVLTRTIELTKVAASFHLADRQVNAEIGEASLWDRPLSVTLRGDLSDDGLRATMKGSARDLPAPAMAGLFGIEGFEAGTAGVAFDAATHCARLGACLEALDGSLHLGARDIAVVGASPFGDVSRFHPIVLAARPTSRKTTWPRADIDLRVLGRKAIVDSVEVIGDVAHFTLTGTGDLATGNIDLTGNAVFPNIRLDPNRSGTGTLTVPVRIGGSVRRLEVTPGTPTTMPAPAEPTAP